MTRTQAFRHMSVAGPGDEVLLLRGLTGTEELGKAFEYTLECVSESPDVVFEDWLGQNVSIRLNTHGGDRDRFLNGIVSQMEQTGMIGRLATYRLQVVPFIWLLTRKADCRIFQDQSVPEIVTEMIKEKGFTDIEDRLSRTYKKREYTVQYRETDMNFISRLMENEGIYYYFLHQEGKHTLVLSDDRGSHEPEEGSAQVPFFPPGAKSVSRAHIYQWRVMKQIQTTAYSTTDYNFQKPKDDLYVRGSKPKAHTFGEIEIFDYPGDHAEYADGEVGVRIRSEELAVGYETIDAQTSSRLVCAGRVFTLTGHPRADQAREYLIVGTTLEATTDAFDGGKIDQEGGSFTFRCGFDCIPAETPYRRASNTAKPVIPGPQTALVTGMEGEEITTDEYGRVKVKFHWDLYNEANEKSSCWLRCSQDFAGKKWGSMYVPRRGQEVIVTFLEGDPDKPIITGRVYNNENKPGYDPKANPTISGIKTSTIKGEGFNEIRFDDKAGHEQIFIHAQKDMDIRVKESVRHTVEKEYHFTVESDYKYQTGGNHDVTVGGNYFETIGGSRHIKVDGSEFKEIAGSQDLTVAGAVTESYSATWTNETSGAIHIKSPTSIVLECGGSKVSILPGGVIIQGGTFLADAGGSAMIRAGGSLGAFARGPFLAKGATAGLKAAGDIAIKGGKVGIKGAAITLNAAAVNIKAGMTKMDGASMSATHIAQGAVVAAAIGTAAGNVV